MRRKPGDAQGRAAVARRLGVHDGMVIRIQIDSDLFPFKNARSVRCEPGRDAGPATLAWPGPVQWPSLAALGCRGQAGQSVKWVRPRRCPA